MNTVTYPVQKEDRVRRQIHIPEYRAEVSCKFPMSEENTRSPSKRVNEQKISDF